MTLFFVIFLVSLIEVRGSVREDCLLPWPPPYWVTLPAARAEPISESGVGARRRVQWCEGVEARTWIDLGFVRRRVVVEIGADADGRVRIVVGKL